MHLMRYLAILSVALGVFLGRVQAQEVSGSDSEAFRRIISNQLQAFRTDDDLAAYSYAAPSIKRIFPSPEIFMQMVRNGYPPVYRPHSYAFGPITTEMNGRPTQRVTIIDAKGKAWIALYSFEKQADGSWKIIGCSLVESQGGEA